MRGFIVELLDEYEKIGQSQIGRLEPGLPSEAVVPACRRKTENIRQLRHHTETVIARYLRPMLANINDISEEDEQDLFGAAQRLSAYETKLDSGLALLIYKTLLQRARAKRDEERIIKYLYWCGITLYYFSESNVGQILEYFGEGANYQTRYHLFGDPETRRYIHRCLANQNMMYYNSGEPEKAMELENRAFGFWNGIIFAHFDPDFPWLNLFLALLNNKQRYLTMGVHSEPDSEPRESIEKILENAITINKLYDKNRASFSVFGGTRYEFYLWEAQLLAGLISFDLFIENIQVKKAALRADDYSNEATNIRMNLSSFIIFYAVKMEKLSGVKDGIVAKTSREIIDYFTSMPLPAAAHGVVDQFEFFAKNVCALFDPADHLNLVLKMTTFRNIPTYAHSICVGKIAAFLAGRILARDPGFFNGIPGARDTNETGDALKQLFETCGLLHDIGKNSYMNNPYMNARVLTEDELAAVKKHPEDGAAMMKRDDGETFGAYRDVILGHHKYYDDSGGYPAFFDLGASKYRRLIDVITVADSIDAATDDVGKTYAGALGFDAVRGELRAQAGIRYAPEIVDLLFDKTVETSIKHIINGGREEAYAQAYLRAWN